MEMRNHICWNPHTIYEVINIDAEAVGDTIFRAVHSPQPMLMSAISTEQLSPGTDQEFLNAFTNLDRPEIFSLLLGDSGMGKTHFIHWLRLNVPEDQKTRVVNIPKVGTSLRNIVKKIIDQLPEELRTRFLSKLTTMKSETHTREQLQQKLLDSLAQAVAVEADRGSEQDMERREILKGLAPLFRDPHIRSQWFLASDRETVIKDLTSHVYELNKEYDRRERDRRFEAADLRIEGVRHADVSLEARNMLTYFRSDTRYLEIAVDLANHCLDAAISEALSFSGEDLIALVAEVRKHLHKQGLSLIIYIEDLSRMQGVDKALLDALTTPSNQGDQKLCPIRWIAAMTTGYFERLEATITTRINLVGKVEAETDPQYWTGPQAQSNLASFMGRYLNAVRLGLNGLNAWDTTHDVPNACDACGHKDTCHNAFGMAGGVGMYPFTAEGLWNMAVRSAPENEFWFKPRRLLKTIVAPMLAVYGRDITEGRFPTMGMVKELGGERLDPLEKVDLYRIAGDEADRHLALQELWQPLSKIVPFPEDILQAFNLHSLPGRAYTGPAPTQSPALGKTASGVERRVVPPKPVGTALAPPPPPPVKTADPIMDKLRDWSNRTPMDDTMANKLRPIVYGAVINHIDWDRGGISRTQYVGNSRPLTQSSIVFRGQTTKSRAQLQLVLPLHNDELSYSRTTIALQGLYLFNEHGHWNFEDGYRYLVYSQICLQEWAEAAFALVRDAAPNNENWNAMDAATELLALGAALSGNISTESARGDLWSDIWRRAPANAPDRLFSSELQNIANSIARKWDKLQEHAKARAAGTKGGQIGNYLNPGERERVVNRLMRNNWKLSMTPNVESEMLPDFREISELYQKIAQSLQTALEAEAAIYRSWLAKMDESFGTEATNRTDMVNVFAALQNELNNGGFLKQATDRFQHSLDAFASATYGDARKRAGVVTGTEAGKCAPYLFGKKNVATAMCKATSLADASAKLLADVDDFYTNRMNELKDTSGGELQACWDDISDTLGMLETALERLACDDEAGGGKS